MAKTWPVVTALLLAGCSSSTGATATLNAAGAPANPSHLTDTDSGQTIKLVVGQQVQVTLGGGSPGSYDQPRSTTAVMHREAASGGYPTGLPAHATFIATAKGRADLVAATDYPCLHATPPCEIAQQEWTVHVVVR